MRFMPKPTKTEGFVFTEFSESLTKVLDFLERTHNGRFYLHCVHGTLPLPYVTGASNSYKQEDLTELLKLLKLKNLLNEKVKNI